MQKEGSKGRSRHTAINLISPLTSQQCTYLSLSVSLSAHEAGSMRQRTVVMYVEIGCFVSCLCGWMLICSTLAIEYWVFSEVGSLVLTTGNYYSNLWMDCVSDATGVSDCKYYPSMMDLSGEENICWNRDIISWFDIKGIISQEYKYALFVWLLVFLHVCRALSVVSVIFGFWGAVLALIGMKCTKIGGSELANARVTFAAALTYMASGMKLLSLASCITID